MRENVSLLITDLDDTIWYWFKVWHAAFTAELEELKKVTGISEDVLIPQIKAIHELHHTSEYAFLLQELPCLRELYGPDFKPKEKLRSVIDAFRKSRKEHTGLYPTVLETLKTVRARGARIVAFTESQQYYSIQRLKVCGLDGIIDVLYATAESENVSERLIADNREYDESRYTLNKTKLVILPLGLKKPNPTVLKDILEDENTYAEEAVYIGDTLSKDVEMAIQANVLSVHAKYGETHRLPGYQLLKAVTHWTEADVKKQATAATDMPNPDIILSDNFGQILDHINFKSPRP